ncbi:MAG: transporter [Thermomicrobiales bacterium]|jgi:pimeloyl-ACP methyl ester carboxylesterase|nr:transporter [Thermomicrobiales bacterium]
MCGAATTSTAQEKQAGSPGTFEPAACSELTIDLGGQVLAADSIPGLAAASCGYLTVLENRSRPSDRTIRLAVAIVPPVAPTPAPDPVVYLAGGPGGSAIASAPGLIDAGLNQDRELILMDQRGATFSNPLYCAKSARFVARRVGLVYDAASTGRRQAAATRACHRALVEDGIDVAAYNTTESAADLADLRAALGVAEWNVYGVSYGTQLALSFMRDHPEGIRTVTVASVVPPHVVSLGRFWDNARRGFDNLFFACAAQQRCHRRHPTLRRTFTRLVRQLESHPVRTRVRPAPGAPRVKVVLDGGALVNWLVLMALGPPNYPEVPNWIDQLAAGRPKNIAASWAALSPQPGNGLQYGVECSEWVPYEAESKLLAKGRKAFPRYPDSVLAQAPQVPFAFKDCRIWDVPKAPAAARAVTRSTIPTLLLSGTFDAVTAPRPARVAARTLPNSTIANIPGVGHDPVDKSDCAARVLRSFLSTPSAPDTGCVAELSPPTLR